MYTHFRIIGVLLMLLALVHFIFPSYFNWKQELSRLSLINKQMMIIHTFFIALVVFLMGLLCFTSAIELVETKLGRNVSLGLGIFWIIRLFVQLFGYSPELWKGKVFETIVHVIFSMFWTYMSLIFCLNYFG